MFFLLKHAFSKHGAIISAQYYKKSNRISIGIADVGLGIKSTISESHIVLSDLKAIKLALTPGITGTTKKEGGTEFNAGAGLFFIKTISKVNKNFFMIYSGNALYKLLKNEVSHKLYADPSKDRHSELENLPYWQGTVVGVDISLNDTKKFSDLLDLIRGAYAKAIKTRKKIRFKKPKFI
jgi:hypothetical protein